MKWSFITFVIFVTLFHIAEAQDTPATKTDICQFRPDVRRSLLKAVRPDISEFSVNRACSDGIAVKIDISQIKDLTIIGKSEKQIGYNEVALLPENIINIKLEGSYRKIDQLHKNDNIRTLDVSGLKKLKKNQVYQEAKSKSLKDTSAKYIYKDEQFSDKKKRRAQKKAPVQQTAVEKFQEKTDYDKGEEKKVQEKIKDIKKKKKQKEEQNAKEEKEKAKKKKNIESGEIKKRFSRSKPAQTLMNSYIEKSDLAQCEHLIKSQLILTGNCISLNKGIAPKPDSCQVHSDWDSTNKFNLDDGDFRFYKKAGQDKFKWKKEINDFNTIDRESFTNYTELFINQNKRMSLTRKNEDGMSFNIEFEKDNCANAQTITIKGCDKLDETVIYPLYKACEHKDQCSILESPCSVLENRIDKDYGEEIIEKKETPTTEAAGA